MSRGETCECVRNLFVSHSVHVLCKVIVSRGHKPAPHRNPVHVASHPQPISKFWNILLSYNSERVLIILQYWKRATRSLLDLRRRFKDFNGWQVPSSDILSVHNISSKHRNTSLTPQHFFTSCLSVKRWDQVRKEQTGLTWRELLPTSSIPFQRRRVL